MGNSDLQEWVEVAEDDDGFKELIQQLPSHLSDFPRPNVWFQRLALPRLRLSLNHLKRLFRRSGRPHRGQAVPLLRARWIGG
jgi:hypothetical protein